MQLSQVVKLCSCDGLECEWGWDGDNSVRVIRNPFCSTISEIDVSKVFLHLSPYLSDRVCLLLLWRRPFIFACGPSLSFPVGPWGRVRLTPSILTANNRWFLFFHPLFGMARHGMGFVWVAFSDSGPCLLSSFVGSCLVVSCLTSGTTTTAGPATRSSCPSRSISTVTRRKRWTTS